MDHIPDASDQCLSCGRKCFEPIAPYRAIRPAHRRFADGRMIMRCKDCGLLQVAPLPVVEELSRFYQEDYRADGFNLADLSLDRYPYDSRFRVSRGRSIRKLYKRLKTGMPPGHVVEIGAGLGHNLVAFREKYTGCELTAIEPDYSCESALKRANTRYFSALWDSVSEEELASFGGPFDLCLVIHVLEHSR